MWKLDPAKNIIYCSFIGIMRRLIKFAATIFFTIIFIGIAVNNAYAVEEPSSESFESNVYLSTRLKQIVEFAAPNNQGLDYFILPDGEHLTYAISINTYGAEK